MSTTIVMIHFAPFAKDPVPMVDSMAQSPSTMAPEVERKLMFSPRAQLSEQPTHSVST